MADLYDIFEHLLKLNQKALLVKGFHTEEDPRNAGIVSNNLVDAADCKIVSGVIIETIPFARAYKVSIGGNRGAVLCCALQTGGANATLSFDSSFYAPGTPVLVAFSPKAMFGTILGAISNPSDGKNFIYHTLLSAASKNEPDISDQACLPLATDDNPFVGVYDFGTGTPKDTTDIGEFGRMTVTGVKMMLNPFMALMALDEFSGLWLFDEDSLTRLSGINLQIRSSGRENEYLNDEGEYVEYEGSALYPWEQLGYLKVPSSDIIEEPETKEITGQDTWKSFAEPKEEKAKPFHRVMSFGGWLGQGKYTQIVAPDPNVEWNKYEKREKQPGLFRNTETVDGYYGAIAAKELFIGKRGFIPSVTRVARPDDTSNTIGDSKDNYHDTNNFKPKAEIPSKGNPFERIMGLQDIIAYQQNYKELFPFLQHKNDYYVPEDSELNKGISRFANFNELASKQFTKVEDKQDLKILEGGAEIPTRELKVSAAESGTVNLDDGSVVSFGGCGEEIKMVGGSIFMDAPGDLWLKSGRKIILWAGDDIEIRAKGHIDISTTEGSVRIKAENQLTMLGGNNEQGGVLIESKGKMPEYDFAQPGEEAKFSGIMLKSASSAIATMGSTLYFRSGVNDEGSGIYFDAKEGEHNIYTLCSNQINYVESSFIINYSNIKTGEVTATTSLTAENNMFCGSIVAHTGSFVGSVYVKDNYFAGGHIYTGDASNYANLVGDYKKGKSDLKKSLEEDENTIKHINPKKYKSIYDTNINETLFEEKKVGAEDTRKQAGFTFRNQSQYNVPSDFAVFESRWQNIGANADKGGEPWEEKPVKSETVEETYPFPGKDYYTSKPCYITQAWTLTNYDTGLFKDRSSGEYEDPQFGDQTKKPLNEYPVIQ